MSVCGVVTVSVALIGAEAALASVSAAWLTDAEARIGEPAAAEMTWGACNDVERTPLTIE
jgi:hypothetical protein